LSSRALRSSRACAWARPEPCAQSPLPEAITAVAAVRACARTEPPARRRRALPSPSRARAGAGVSAATACRPPTPLRAGNNQSRLSQRHNAQQAPAHTVCTAPRDIRSGRGRAAPALQHTSFPVRAPRTGRRPVVPWRAQRRRAPPPSRAPPSRPPSRPPPQADRARPGAHDQILITGAQGRGWAAGAGRLPRPRPPRRVFRGGQGARWAPPRRPRSCARTASTHVMASGGGSGRRPLGAGSGRAQPRAQAGSPCSTAELRRVWTSKGRHGRGPGIRLGACPACGARQCCPHV
jgi:hypothetical protein